MSERRKRILLGTIVGLGCAFALALRWDVPQRDVRSGRVIDTQPLDGLAVKAGIDTNELESGEDVRIWLVFHNRSAQPVEGLRFVDVKFPGFDRGGDCWWQYEPACDAGGVLHQLNRLLAPGATSFVSGTLSAGAAPGRYAVLFTYAWTNPKGGDFRDSVIVGPVEVTRWWQLAAINLATRLKAVITDLGLPILLLLGGWWLNELQKARDDTQKRAEAARAQAQKEAEQTRIEAQRERDRLLKQAEDARTLRQTQTAAILNTLLQSNLADTQRYYLPLASRTDRLIRQSPPRTGSIPEVRRCFHALMTFLRQQKLMADEIGGFHLKSRTGEGLLGGAWRYLRGYLDVYIEQEIRSAALKDIESAEDLATFNKRVDMAHASAVPRSSHPLAATQAAVEEWIDDVGSPLCEMIPVLQIFLNVLVFEMNRPYEYWYGKAEEFQVDKLKAVQRQLPTQANLPAKVSDPQVRQKLGIELNQLLSDLKVQLEAYITEGDAWNAARHLRS